jgi:ABC-type spermidine/putrescine transport system permease subunit I
LDRRFITTNLPASAVQSVQTQSTKLAAIAVPQNLDSGTQQLIGRAIDESFVSGFRWIMAIGAALAAAGAVTALFSIGATRVRAGHEP